MRICMVMSLPFPPEEGIGYHVYNLSKKLIERGHEITVITRGSLTRETDFLDGIEILKVPFIPLYPFHVTIHGFFVNKLFKSMECGFDIVHVHTPLPPIIKTSLPIVSTIHTSLREDARHIEVVDLKSLSTKVLARLVSSPLVSKQIENSKEVITVSNSVAHELKAYYGLDDAVVVGNGVNEKEFVPINEKKEENFILYVGRLSYRKGLFDLLDAAIQILQHYNVKFLLVGKGELEKKLDERTEKERLQDKIVLLGHVEREKLIQLYQNAMMFVLPSHYEGLPTVLLEAMACGLPTVVTAVSGCLDVIEDEHNGLLIPPKSPEKMAEAITQLIEDDKLRYTLGRNARVTIEGEYTWDSVTDRVEKCYNLALKS